MATAVANDAGNWGASFKMPERRSGAVNASGSHLHEVFIQGSVNFALFTAAAVRTLWPTAASPAPNSRADTPQNGLIVKPWLDRSPGTGPPGTRVQVKGTGFTFWETGITVVFDPAGVNKTVASGITANDRGTWEASFRVPDRAAVGGQLISAAGDGGTNVTQYFSVVRGLRLIPRRVSPGATVYLVGRGFAISSATTVKLDGNPLTTSPATLTTTASGVFLASFALPAGTAYGAHEITATDATSGVATAELVVVRSAIIQLNPKYGIPGDIITITGTGFNGNVLMSFDFDDRDIAPRFMNPPAVLTNADGTFTATFPVPERERPGYHRVIATDMYGESDSADFTVQSPPVRSVP